MMGAHGKMYEGQVYVAVSAADCARVSPYKLGSMKQVIVGLPAMRATVFPLFVPHLHPSLAQTASRSVQCALPVRLPACHNVFASRRRIELMLQLCVERHKV